MAKHSFEFKKKVVLEYLDGKGGTPYLSKKYGLGSDSQLRKWINAYNVLVAEGLMRSSKQIKYSFEKKISVVELYLSSEISYQDLAIREGISNTSMIANWVNRFHAACPYALKSCKKGRKNTLDKPKIDIKAQEAEERKLKDLLSYTGMPKATYMYRQKRFDRKSPDKEIKDKILEIRETHKDYGYRRVVGELRNKGYCVNKKKVQRIIQKLGLQVTSFIRKSRKYSSYKGKVRTIPSNRIRRRFNTYIPHQKITTDTTEFKYYDINAKGHMTMHKLYPDSFMDMCNGEIISSEIDKHPSSKNVMDALEQAIAITSDCKYRRTFHSD